MSIIEDKSKWGKLITFEGIDGCGKSTQATLLYEELLKRNVKVLHTQEPCKHEQTSIKLREVIFNKDTHELTRFFLFLAERSHHVRNIIYPAITSGFHVICDRYIHSTIVYQKKIFDLFHSYNIYTKERIADNLVNFSCFELMPDLTFFIDAPASVAKSRMKIRENDILDNVSEYTLEGYRNAYFDLARAKNSNIQIISGIQTIEAIHISILSKVGAFLSLRNEDFEFEGDD